MSKKALKRKRERLEDDEPPRTNTPPPPNYGARVSTAKVCATCEHSYIRPCTTPAMLAKCPNAQHLAAQSKGNKSAKAR